MPLIGPTAIKSPIFKAIDCRLQKFSPPIKLRDHIVDNPQAADDLQVHDLLLQGIDFTLKDREKFISAVALAKVGIEKAFGEGGKEPSDWKKHWAMAASMMATNGIGFREPWRYVLNDRAARLQDVRPNFRDTPEMDRDFAGYFGAANPLDLSALHISVADVGKSSKCNIHVDATGIAMVDLQDPSNFSITPNFLPHLVNELLFKTVAEKKLHLPTWFIDRVNLHVLSPETNYRRIGVSVDVLKGRSYKLTLSASCGLASCPDVEFSKILKLDVSELNSFKDALMTLNATANLTGRFNLGGG
jgi:hypothetical protein